MKTTGAGDLDQRIRIEAKTRVEDEGGGSAEAWTPVATVWAKVWPVSGRERAEARQVQAATLMRFKLRYRDGLDAGMRIVWQGKAHNIRFIADAGRREAFLTIDAEAGVAL
ncbi:SPP1 family predicted phage head-tail adaptor [Azospirillum lipoferum]|uniref:Phage head closure protein n=1 Tax=Azospirillum lipoferum TaxID=193 RepID=A0A5A9GI47_AZOLI|nr:MULTISPECIES: phage head closure protein [Azospirillum]KAA0592949.1 phage head closure protein [Azospirillum lipoferum]MCP1613994.1 SPP1 family predicted phage head-tail adaptor [Azospirillum lipoferum]MDW5537614.1 phage head closure protein [Azospirillum sp. NL1]